MIKFAADKIKKGELVAFPTETVYGLGADASNEDAVQKIYKLKGRPSNNPLIIHVDSLEEAKKYAQFNEAALRLAEHFWPGPLTMVLPFLNGSDIAKSVTAGLNTIAIRIPSHKMALDLIREANCAIAAPSANISGYVSPTSHFHVRSNFEDVYILEGDNSEYGLESTILDLSSNNPEILRYGFITPEAISNVLGFEVFYHNNDASIKAPGMMYKHYSPRSRVRLEATFLNEGEVGLGFGGVDLGEMNLSKIGSLEEAAANLYNMLQILDKYNLTIAIAPIPYKGVGLAINDRLKRAAV